VSGVRLTVNLDFAPYKTLFADAIGMSPARPGAHSFSPTRRVCVNCGFSLEQIEADETYNCSRAPRKGASAL